MYASKSTVTAVLMAGVLLSSQAVLGQNAGGMGGGAMAQSHSRAGSGTRLQDRDRLSTHGMDRMHERMQDRLYERDLLRERDRDRIYGGNLMSTKEREQYERRLRSLPTARERVRYRMEHQHEMQMRAEKRHIRLGPALSEARITDQERARQREREQIYGYSMMSPKEVARYEARMGAARTAQEREHIRTEHRRQMMERARAPGKSPAQ